jgi:hypothetical protein
MQRLYPEYCEKGFRKSIFYSLTKEYEKMLKPFFKILHENKILETI